MRYLLINHVPFAKGLRPNSYRVGDLFREDLQAQAQAIANEGGTMTVATCFLPEPDVTYSGSFNVVDVVPEELGFKYVELPMWKTYKQYFQLKSRMRQILLPVIREHDIVQMDYGGYAMSVGQAVWPLATALKKKRIWLFDGADPFPRMENDVQRQSNSLKRFALRVLYKHFVRFCRGAIRDADLVFAHNKAVQERFAEVWGPQCHQFDRSFVTQQIMLESEKSAERSQRWMNRARPLRIVSAGRQIKIKATDHVLRALKLARDEGANLVMDIMGDGEDLKSFVALKSELGLDDIVRVRGTVDYGKPLFDAWDECDIMAITNLTAEISRNVLLAAARGMPIVSYTNPGTDAMLKESKAALLVESGSIEQLAAAFLHLDRNRDQLITLMEAGLSMAGEKTLQRTHERRAQLVKEVMDRA
jgi:glycosyltransferase involved in cell wall biosynthesis